ncbi:hypothetical protein [Halorubrum vacuolatum]|uniref:Uncharacterized protein n=1 Tax=Halorubrum vacuolatum TaxID=63740 RepID=A0A238W923_HALVU|nr:hypothetical protein [Halorubrum vacuolatum]SNR43008.1 hypothetical protein SAMN06264855_10653 [Halorubrum vacuolatum]
MTDCEIIIKGELHSSKGDLAHERELLVEGVDHLILEGPENEAEYSLTQQWYAFVMMLTNYLFFRILQTDSSVLEDITKAQDGEVVKTRKSDASVLENSHSLARVAAAIMFLGLFSISAFYGILGNHLLGVPLLLGSALVPLLFLRFHESARTNNSRNELMAELITDAAKDGGRVVAVVGDNHAEPIIQHLPGWIDPVREKPVYSSTSWRHLKDVSYPIFLCISALWVFYSLFVAYVEFVWSLSI